MPLFSSYIDLPDFLANGLPNSETASLVGGNAVLSVGASLGATSLTPSTTTGFPPSAAGSFVGWILDGANSESVVCSVSGSTLSVPAGTLAAHAAGVSISSAGTAGCLASLIVTSSALIEHTCKQGPDGGDKSLWLQQRVEKLSGPSLRTAFDVDGNLVVRPYHWPITNAASCLVQMGPQTSATIDLTYAYIPGDARVITIPWAQTITVQPGVTSWLIAPYPRWYQFVATITYTGGPCSGTTLATVPQPLKEACYLLVMDRLGFRVNPVGAANVSLGDQRYEMRLRGDTSGKSLLRMQAEAYLALYTTKF